MLVVLDTNVLVSGMIVATHPPGRIVDLLRTGALRLAVDDRILAEYEDVLARPYFRRYFTLEQTERVMAFIRSDSVQFVCADRMEALPDPMDAPFAETALVAGVPLITGNMKHYPPKTRRGIRVITPAEFLDELQG